MKTAAFVLAVLLGLCTFPPLISQEPAARAPGDDWMRQTEAWKLGYVYGWGDGERSVISRECIDTYTTSSRHSFERAEQRLSALPRECRSTGTTPSPAQFESCVKERGNTIKVQLNRQHEQQRLELQSCEKDKKKSLGIPANYTMGQFVAGIDHFYADYRNRLIPVDMIAEEVEKQINGATDAEIQADLELDRKAAQSSPDSNDYKR